MSNLATLRAALRQDLKDVAGAGERWADAVLDRHLKRAVLEYSQVSPQELTAAIATVVGSRDLSISTLTNVVRVVAVEWKTGEFPKHFRPFSRWGTVLTLDIEETGDGTNANVFYHKTHDINGSVSFPAIHDDVILAGGAGYALLEYAAFVANRVTTGGERAWGEFKDLAEARLATFRGMLRMLPEANRVRSSQLYAPVPGRFKSETTDPGPQ